MDPQIYETAQYCTSLASFLSHFSLAEGPYDSSLLYPLYIHSFYCMHGLALLYALTGTLVH